MKPMKQQQLSQIATLIVRFQREHESAGEMSFRGSPEFLESARDATTFVVGQVASNYGVAGERVGKIGRELMDAHHALRRGDEYSGEYVSVTSWRVPH